MAQPPRCLQGKFNYSIPTIVNNFQSEMSHSKLLLDDIKQITAEFWIVIIFHSDYCHSNECHSAVCRAAMCHSMTQNDMIIIVSIILNVVLVSVILLNVKASNKLVLDTQKCFALFSGSTRTSWLSIGSYAHSATATCQMRLIIFLPKFLIWVSLTPFFPSKFSWE